MRKKIIAGNWKMHGTRQSVATLLTQIKEGAACINNVDIIVFPPFVFFEQTSQLLMGTHIQWGGQNVYEAQEGAYTGEISPNMLKDFGCQYVLIGHSERRHVFGEPNEQVADKFLLAGRSGLTPILCVGETEQEREQGATFEVISKQLRPILESKEGRAILQDAIIAYEPVWAIGTGKTASPEQAQEIHQFIRKEVEKIDKPLAEKVRILYGGSVKKNNAGDLFAMPDIDGGLIGGASLNANEFLEIARLCK